MASEYITDVVDPTGLTGYVRELVDGDLPFAVLFPPLRTDDIEYELTNADLSAQGEVARYRAWDTPSPIGKRPGLTIIQGELVPLSHGYRLNEKEIKQFERLRSGIADRSDQTVERTIYSDAERAGRAVQNRLTLAHGSILQTGAVAFTELGNPETGNALSATFAVPGAHLGVVPAGAVWSNHAGAVPVTDFLAWEATFRSNNGGRNPDGWGMSTEVMADLAANTQIKTLAGGTSGVTPGIIGPDQVQQVFRAAGVQAPLLVGGMFDTERPTLTSGTPARVINNRKVIGVLAGMGNTLYTEPAAVGGLVRAGATQLAALEPGIIAYQTGGIDPAWAKTTAEGLGVPILRIPSGLFVATV